MALVTIQRSPSPSTDQDLDAVDSSEDVTDSKSQIRKSLSESYFTVKGAALILPHTECTKKSSKKSHGGEIQSHLQAMLHLLRPEDTIKIAVRLEDASPLQHRYMALVSTRGRQDTEEAVILGIDCTGAEASIGLVLPVWMGLKIKLGGDGGFSLCTDEQAHLFNPVSVQAMWSAIQSLVKVLHTAEEMKYIHDGLTHTWVGYYKSRIDRALRSWNEEGVEIFAPSSLSIKSEGEEETIKMTISQKLKEVMMTTDLDEATSIMLRKAVEEKMGRSLTEFKSYFDEEVMRILGQMDEPSEILEFLYLGSEWNASNLEELKDKGIGYILNVTKEIDNFFVGMFQYYNVRVYDVPESELLKHWDKTYKFINKARNHHSKVLVHCKMGVSRSASTVMAFLMKDRRWTVQQAYQFVKDRRSCVHPNAGFMEQLLMYEGILNASNKRDIFRCKSDQNLLEEGTKDETELDQGSFLGDSLFHMMSHSDWPVASGGVAREEEWIQTFHKDDELDVDMLQVDTDLETAESRSADSIEESLPDMPSPPPPSSPKAGPPIVKVTPATAGIPAQSARPLASARVSGSDQERTPEPESGAESDTHSARCSSDGSDRTSTSHPTAIGQGLRIKPDSSWIRLDSLEAGGERESLCTENLPYIDALPSDSHLGQTPPTNTLPTTGASTNTVSYSNSFLAQGDSASLQMTTNTNSLTSSEMPASGNQTIRSQMNKSSGGEGETGSGRAEFYVGNEQNEQANQSDLPVIVISSDVTQQRLPASGSVIDPIWAHRSNSAVTRSLTDLSATGSTPADKEIKDREKSPALQHEEQQEKETEVLAKAEGGEKSGATSETPTKTPLSKLEPGVQQYFREKIPWKPGKVRKIQEDINKTGQIMQEDEEGVEEEETEDTVTDGVKETASGQDMADDRALLDLMSEHSSSTLSQSRSCMELFTPGEASSGAMSLYEREEIPMEPGTVLRTRLEIEERQRLFCGEGDQEIFGSARPVVRTSSLKHERDTPRSRYTDNRRLTCGPILSPVGGKSLDDLRSVGVNDVDVTDYSSLTSDRLGQDLMKDEVGLTAKDKTTGHSPVSGDVASSPPVVITPPSAAPSWSPIQSRTADKSGDIDSRHKQPDTGSSQCSGWKQQRTKGNFDSETLALIREIGSALLMSPAPPKTKDSEEDESCTNMVKYFVRKIEKQTKISQPARNIILIENDPKKGGQSSEMTTSKVKTVSPSKDMTSGPIASAFQPVVSPAEISGDVHSHNLGAQTKDSHLKAKDRHLVSQQGFQAVSSPETGSGEICAEMSRKEGVSLAGVQAYTSGSGEGDQGVTIPTCLPLAKPPEELSAMTTGASSFARSPGQSCGSESPDASVVRQLVDRFEIRSPESERCSSELGHDFSSRRRDSSSSLPTLSPLAVRKQNQSEDVSGLTSIPQSACQSQTHFRPIFSHPTSTAASSHQATAASAISSSDSSSPLVSLHRKHASLDSAHSLATIAAELHDVPSTKWQNTSAFGKDDAALQASSSLSRKKTGPMPFSRSSMEIPENKVWRPVRPKSADQHQRSVSSSDYAETSGQESASSRKAEDRYHNFPCEDDISIRQVSEEGRKIRRLHGKSHPLTKLSERRLGTSPFHSSM